MKHFHVFLLLYCLPVHAANFEDLVQLADQGDADSQFLVGYSYAHGEISEEDPVKAVTYYKLAASQGHSRAQYQLALMYMRGVGVEENSEEAGRLFESAAKAEHERASLDTCVYRYFVAAEPKEAAFWCYVGLGRNPKDDYPTINMILDKIKGDLSVLELEAAKKEAAEYLEQNDT